MRIVSEDGQTDLNAGIVTLEDERGARRHYVRRDNNATLPGWPALVAGRDGVPWLSGGPLDEGGGFPEQLSIVRTEGSISAEKAPAVRMADIRSTHEFRADERAFRIWRQFRACQLQGRGDIDALVVKEMLAAAGDGHDCSIEEVERELVLWSRDKARSERAHH